MELLVIPSDNTPGGKGWFSTTTFWELSKFVFTDSGLSGRAVSGALVKAELGHCWSELICTINSL